MKIKNESDIRVSWYCFNQRDAIRLAALASGTLSQHAGENVETLDPPRNVNDLYFLRFAYIGGALEISGQTISKHQTVTIRGAKDHYTTVVN